MFNRDSLASTITRWLSEWSTGIRPSCGAAAGANRTDVHIDQLLPDIAGEHAETIVAASVLALELVAEFVARCGTQMEALLVITLTESDGLVPAPRKLVVVNEADMFRPPELIVERAPGMLGRSEVWSVEEYRCPMIACDTQRTRSFPAMYRSFRLAEEVSSGAMAFARTVELGGGLPSSWPAAANKAGVFGRLSLDLDR